MSLVYTNLIHFFFGIGSLKHKYETQNQQGEEQEERKNFFFIPLNNLNVHFVYSISEYISTKVN